MSRALFTAAVLLGPSLSLAAPVLAKTAYDGVWLFDDTPPTPGVTMMQVTSKGGKIEGTVTTQWYGPVEMLNPHVDGGTLKFDTRNINDREHPTRPWSVAIQGGKAHLKGRIWESEVDASGYRGKVKDAQARTFKFSAPLPALGAPIPSKLAATPPMGWSSWNKFAEHIDDKTVRAMADAMVSTGLRDAGYLYVNIDDGWQGKRDANGVLQPNEKFPDMKALTDYVHSKGLKIGIYSSQGPRTCAGYEGSYGHVRQDAQTYADWGFDYLKYDLCSGEWFYDNADTVKRSYYEMGAALQATGRDFIFSLCEYGRFDVGSWGRDVGGQLWRTTGDITDDYPTMAKIGFDKNGKPEWAGPHGFNDPDMLEIGNGGMSADEYRTHMTLWAMSAAPLMMGHDLRETSPETLAMLTNPRVIAVDQDAKGVQAKALRKQGTMEVWAKPLADGRVALALFNRGDATGSLALTPGDAGLTAVNKVEDVWSGAKSAKLPASYTVPARGAVMVVVGG
ncbi:glycoside hydrolase family 27 protein [Novosphingobium sp. P6W]|uniref:glycoside hydrolase family 27 protein n=1 Tax=Novosphingobium sp. P6W TaxID=1609758 RepID=UPI0005C2ADB6|nr:glycoside hydrolase family 27 protein [Novosphingobium sp. P6W]AXB79529.1 glycoside hydrolase family 27 protein [Novosphingobium sp. P6W]KIS34276.1 glycoside hydrolase family 27 [Novosphingobium sp. P6W]